jgi:hypothetical protein
MCALMQYNKGFYYVLIYFEENTFLPPFLHGDLIVSRYNYIFFFYNRNSQIKTVYALIHIKYGERERQGISPCMVLLCISEIKDDMGTRINLKVLLNTFISLIFYY